MACRDMITRTFEVFGQRDRLVSVPLMPVMLEVAGGVIPGSELIGDVARRMNLDLDFDDGAAGRDFGYSPRGLWDGSLVYLFGA